MCTGKRHITGLYMLRRLSAARATKKPSRALPFVGFFSATFLRSLELLRNSFIATAKTSYTTRTLSERKTRIYIYWFKIYVSMRG